MKVKINLMNSESNNKIALVTGASRGLGKFLSLELAKKGIVSMEDLAEQSVDELMDIESMSEEKAGKLIMEARAPWFEE